MSRTGTKRKRREAETDVLFDGTDFIWSLPIHGKQDNRDNPVNTGKIIIRVTIYNANCIRHTAILYTLSSQFTIRL